MIITPVVYTGIFKRIRFEVLLWSLVSIITADFDFLVFWVKFSLPISVEE